MHLKAFAAFELYLQFVYLDLIFRGNDLIGLHFSFALLIDVNILQTPSSKESLFKEVTKKLDVDPFQADKTVFKDTKCIIISIFYL